MSIAAQRAIKGEAVKLSKATRDVSMTCLESVSDVSSRLPRIIDAFHCFVIGSSNKHPWTYPKAPKVHRFFAASIRIASSAHGAPRLSIMDGYLREVVAAF